MSKVQMQKEFAVSFAQVGTEPKQGRLHQVMGLLRNPSEIMARIQANKQQIKDYTVPTVSATVSIALAAAGSPIAGLVIGGFLAFPTGLATHWYHEIQKSEDSKTPPEWLIKHATSGGAIARENIARRLDAPMEALMILRKDAHEDIAEAAEMTISKKLKQA